MTPAQCRAARALLNWNQDTLAQRAKVGTVTVRQFEGEKASPRNATLTVLQSALEAAGVIFIQENGEGPGVRLRKHPALDPFAGEGATGLEMAKRFAKETAEMKDGDLVASNPPYGEKTVMGRTIWGRPKKPKD